MKLQLDQQFAFVSHLSEGCYEVQTASGKMAELRQSCLFPSLCVGQPDQFMSFPTYADILELCHDHPAQRLWDMHRPYLSAALKTVKGRETVGL